MHVGNEKPARRRDPERVTLIGAAGTLTLCAFHSDGLGDSPMVAELLKIEAFKTELGRMRQAELIAAKRGDFVRQNELYVLIEKRLKELEWLESLVAEASGPRGDPGRSL